MNIVMNDAGRFIEVQGTAEGHAFTDDEFSAMLDFGTWRHRRNYQRTKRGDYHGTIVTSMPDKVVMASGNAGKIREIARLLEGLGIEVVAQSELGVEDAEETGTTFHRKLTAQSAACCGDTGLPAIADDSGLVSGCT